ncbi:MAG TPA: GNAT family N-acetyltransferase [Actinomycetota bacterium]|nr:GNAT family N-acetyltransferase [Actinomycetota bacterium]
MTLPAGYAVRPATEDDVDAIVAVGNAYDVADFGRADTAREHVLDDFHASGFEAGDDSWLVLDHRGNPVAFGLVETGAIRVVDAFGRVHPEHWGRGIGAFLLDTMETRAARIAWDRAEDRVVHNAVTSTDATARRLLDDRGYVLVRFFWHMERSLRRADARIVPDGSAFDVRVAEGEDDLRAARGTLDEAFRGHWMAQPWAFEDWRRHVAEASVSTLMASVSDEVAGAVTWTSTSAGGWIEELGVREPDRGRGLGGLLLRHAFARLADAGVREVRLNVDAQNATGATRLYERVGMRVRREWLVYEKPVATG